MPAHDDVAGDGPALIHLTAPLGQPGSGRVRYAAAMHFRNRGRLSDDALEVFRICSAIDAEDPAGLLRSRRLTADLNWLREVRAGG